MNRFAPSPSSDDAAGAARSSLLHRLRDWGDHGSWQDFFDTYWKLIGHEPNPRMNRWLRRMTRLFLPDPPRRYRVTPRQNPFELRRQLRRNIRNLLRRPWSARDLRL